MLFALVALVILAIFSTLFSIVIGFLHKLGLGFITRFFLNSIFFTEDTMYKQNIIWNKPVVRFVLVFAISGLIGIVAYFGILEKIIDESRSHNIRNMFFVSFGVYLIYCVYINFFYKKNNVQS